MKMKTITKNLLIVSVLVLGFTSCRKEPTTQPQSSSNYQVRDINVEYRIYCESAAIDVKYFAPVNGIMQEVTESVNRNEHSIIFSGKSATYYSVEAWNQNPDGRSIVLDIYVDGQLFKTGSADHHPQVAKAEGIPY
jgi:hypothetical protein